MQTLQPIQITSMRAKSILPAIQISKSIDVDGERNHEEIQQIRRVRVDGNIQHSRNQRKAYASHCPSHANSQMTHITGKVTEQAAPKHAWKQSQPQMDIGYGGYKKAKAHKPSK